MLTLNPSAEVIALSLRTSGVRAYLNVQGFTGTMYIVSFLFSMGFLLPRFGCPVLTIMLVWFLRSWKLQQLELLGLDEKGETAQHQGSSAVEQAPAAPRRLRGWLTYVDSMVVVKKV